MSTPFTPAPIRYRVWDGKTMHYPDDLGDVDEEFLLRPDGQVRRFVWYGDSGGAWGEDEGLVPMLSTGLRDAAGREVFEGDVDEWGGDAALGTYPDGGFTVHGWHWLSPDGERTGMALELDGSLSGRVVGHVFEGAPAEDAP